MKIEANYSSNSQVMQATTDLLFYLEMGNIAGQQGNDQEAIDWYVKGLQQAKNQADKPRIQQFSNLILTYL
jgi:HEAT repeat protein